MSFIYRGATHCGYFPDRQAERLALNIPRQYRGVSYFPTLASILRPEQTSVIQLCYRGISYLKLIASGNQLYAGEAIQKPEPSLELKTVEPAFL
jgi:hypothetical protein